MRRCLWILAALIQTTSVEPALSSQCPFVLAEKGYELPTLPPSLRPNLKILWWNVQKGETNTQLDGRPLDHNLCALVEAPQAPDVIVLAEYDDTVLSSSTLSKLKELYPHFPERFYPTNDTWNERGMMVFSRHPFQVTNPVLLDYHPTDKTDAEEISKYKAHWKRDNPYEASWPRHYIELNLKVDNREIAIIPIHLLQPWEKMYRDAGGGFFANVFLKLNIVFGRTNPLINQIIRLRNQLEQDFGPSLDKKPFVLFGDFNLPPKIKWFTTRPYKTISPHLTDPFSDRMIPTWPAKLSAEATRHVDEQHRLDLVFHSQQITTTMAEVPLWAGSDHYPLYVVFE